VLLPGRYRTCPRRGDRTISIDVRSLLKQYGIQPSKGLGQNFLVDRRVLERIVEVSDLSPADVVLEVGPGLGVLTRELAERAGVVVAVELDRKMVAVLHEQLAGYANVHLVQGDILEIDPVQAIMDALGLSSNEALRYKVVANLPYYITSAVLRHLLTAAVPPAQLTLLVQKEVAARLTARPGDLSLLAISVQVFGEPEVVTRVPAGSFYPRPKVDSAVVRIRVYPEPRVPREELERFFAVVQAGFGQKRKQLHNSLSHNLRLPQETVLELLARAGIDPQRRPQTLTIDEWISLARAYGEMA